MKLITSLLVLSIFSVMSHLMAQPATDTGSSSNASAENLIAGPQKEVDQEKQEFIKKYELENLRGIRSKMLDNGQMRTEPSPEALPTGVNVPKNEIVYVYRYFPDEKCWAAKFKDDWGFIDDFLIFPTRSSEPETSSEYDEPPRLKSSISPKYPKEAKEAGIKGKVYIKVYIDKDGKAKETIILEGIKELNQAAIDAVTKARYEPAKLKGKPVGVWVNLSITFE